jgi:hypothetical protein
MVCNEWMCFCDDPSYAYEFECPMVSSILLVCAIATVVAQVWLNKIISPSPPSLARISCFPTPLHQIWAHLLGLLPHFASPSSPPSPPLPSSGLSLPHHTSPAPALAKSPSLPTRCSRSGPLRPTSTAQAAQNSRLLSPLRQICVASPPHLLYSFSSHLSCGSSPLSCRFFVGCWFKSSTST